MTCWPAGRPMAAGRLRGKEFECDHGFSLTGTTSGLIYVAFSALNLDGYG